MAVVTKIDKNGTKYWYEHKCPRCGGSGYLSEYSYISGGVCFKCNGSGDYPHTWKEYTKEYAAKLEERRRAKFLKKVPEINAKFFKDNGFNENGECFVVTGNTFEIKDELKESGAKFNYTLLWHFDKDVDTYKTIKVTVDDICEVNAFGIYNFKEDSNNTVQKMLEAAIENKGNYVGNIGDKINIQVTYKGYHTFETFYTYNGVLNYIYKFEDENGNVLIWKTASSKDFEEGKSYMIKGTVKNHTEYKGIRQTNLTRCRVVA